MIVLSPWRRRTIIACVAICILSLANTLWGADPGFKLVGPKEADLGRPFEVSVEGFQLPLSTFQQQPPQITWLVLGGEAQVKQRVELVVSMESGKPIWSASPYVSVTPSKAAKVYVVLTVDLAGKFAQQASLEVTCGPFPDPGPDPKPDPNPKPDPTPPGPRWVMMVEESSQRTPGLAAVISSESLRQYVSSKGHHWRVWDKDLAKDQTAPAEIAPWLNRAAGKQLPWLMISDDAGRVLWEGPCPADPISVQQLIVKHGG